MRNLTQTDWLRLVTPLQRTALVHLLETAPRSRAEEAHRMLQAAGHQPTSEEASARIGDVIRYLTGGDRIGAGTRQRS